MTRRRPSSPGRRCTSTRAPWSNKPRLDDAAMKYFHLIWAALFRRKTRTLFTLISVLAAFLLFGLLDSVRVAFSDAGNSIAGVDRLLTISKISFTVSLPQSLQARIEAVPGVK